MSGSFRTCFSVLTALDHLSLGIGGLSTKLAGKLAGEYVAAVRRGLPPAQVGAAVVSKLDDEFDRFVKLVNNKLPGQMKRVLAPFPKEFRGLFGDDLTDAIIFSGIRVVHSTARASINALVNRLLTDPAAALGPASKKYVEEQIGQWVNSDIENEFSVLKPCYELWSPVLTMSITSSGRPGLVVSDTFLNPFLEATGGISLHEE